MSKVANYGLIILTESELMGMRMLGFMEMHVNTKAWL